MRTTQIYGLTEKAKKFLDENVEKIPDIVCPKCEEIVTHKKNSRMYENARDAGMNCDGPKLREYVLKNGEIVREVINKYRPWSSGLCLFLDIVDKDGNVLYGWTEKEINEMI